MTGNEAQLISDALGTGVNRPLAFYTNGVRRFNFDYAGNIIFGDTASIAQGPLPSGLAGWYHQNSNGYNQARCTGGGFMDVLLRSTGATALNFIVGSTGVGNISCGTSSTAYNTTSDYRLKRDVREMPDCRAYFKALRPILHYWIAENADNTLPTAGFLAHELQEVFPQAVTGAKDGVDEEGNIVIQGVDYAKLTPYLSAAVKSLIAENEQQAEDLRVLKLQMAAVLEQLNLMVDTTTPPEAV